MIFGTPQIVTNGLVLHLDAGNRKSYVSGSTVWNDLSGNNRTGSLVNSPTFNVDAGGSIVLNGSNNYITFGNILNDVLAGTNNKFTLSLWINRSVDDATVGLIFAKFSDSPTPNERQIALQFRNISSTGQKIYFNYTEKPDNTGYFRFIQATPTLNIQTWYNICCSYDGSINTNNGLDRVKIYANGVPQSTTMFQSGGSLSNTITGSIAPLTIGMSVSSGGTINYAFPGRINLPQIYNRVLTDQEVAQNYNALKSRFNTP